jgi:polyisoprenoid-binding protein YceI
MRRPTPRHLRVLLLFLGLTLTLAATGVARDQPAVEGMASPQPSGSAAAPSDVPFRIDAGKSQFFIDAEAGGVLAAFGHNHKFKVRDFGGIVKVPSQGLQFASLDLNVVPDSLALVDKVSDDERKEIEASMREKVLETAKFPKAWFRSAGVTVDSSNDAGSHLSVLGNLWIHGVGHKITIPATVVLKGDTLRATGTMKMRQTDYGITPFTAVAGTVRVKDEVTLSFDFVATRP